uniref:Major facilitator superfamily domain-containing protein 9 n=1 Tax=Timema genevievae TaxID=629358 RepID=A0A7R9K3T7_TIMGE|nr:unnamed protein product [Timema genevievae]
MWNKKVPGRAKMSLDKLYIVPILTYSLETCTANKKEPSKLQEWEMHPAQDIGSWSDIKGRRSILVVTMAICSISYLALGATTAISVVVLVRIILGVLKHTQTLCKTLVADVVSSAKQADVSGKLTAYSSIGFMVGPAIGGNLAELENGFTLVCCVVAVIFWANLAIAYIFVPLDSGDAHKLYNKQIDTDLSSKKAPRTELLRAVTELANVDWAHYWDVFALKFLLGLAMANFFMQYGLAIQEKFEVSPKWVGYTISFQGTISAASSFSSSWLERLYGASDGSRARQMFHSFAVLTISFFLIDYAPSLGMFVIGLLPMSASTSLLRLSTNDMVIRRTPPDKRGSLVGSGNSISSVARLIAPIFSGENPWKHLDLKSSSVVYDHNTPAGLVLTLPSPKGLILDSRQWRKLRLW